MTTSRFDLWHVPGELSVRLRETRDFSLPTGGNLAERDAANFGIISSAWNRLLVESFPTSVDSAAAKEILDKIVESRDSFYSCLSDSHDQNPGTLSRHLIFLLVMKDVFRAMRSVSELALGLEIPEETLRSWGIEWESLNFDIA